MKQDRYRDLALITPEAMRSCVLYDGQTRLWFRRLLASPGVQQAMASGDESYESRFRRYRYVQFVLQALPAAVPLLLIAQASDSGHALTLRIALVACILALMAGSFWEHRALAVLSAQFIGREFPTIPAGMTVYQMAEVLSRKYAVPSLVDVIWRWEQWQRNAFLLFYLGAFGLYFLSLKDIILWTVAGCLGAVYLVKCLVLAGAFRMGSASTHGVKEKEFEGSNDDQKDPAHP